jgi:vacuolar-type H+-ATPase subunit E/Vma4
MIYLTNKELERLEQVLTEIENQYDEELGACAKMFNYDNDIIDIEVELTDGSIEIINLDRKTFKEI